MIITISGAPGAGKSTIAKILAKKLSAERIDVGGIRREIAKKKGMTLQELNKYGLKNPETDVDVDKEAAKKAREISRSKNVVVEGRTQFYFIPESIKIFLDVDFNEGARRIWDEIQDKEKKEKRNEDIIGSFEDMKKSLKKRTKSDYERYKKYYNIDCNKKEHYDFLIDTTGYSTDEIIKTILKYLKTVRKI
jgi:CMP/dCMP kinase